MKAKKPRQMVLSVVRCHGETRKGHRCTFKQKHGSFCLKHAYETTKEKK